MQKVPAMQEVPLSAETHGVEMPCPTAWPMILALGVALALTAMVTNIAVGILGLVLAIAGGVGWFLQVLPHEAHEVIPVSTEEIKITSRRTLGRTAGEAPQQRKIMPVETFQVTTGIKGGIAGGIAMVVPAGLYGLIRYHSLWYPINLLAAGGFVSWAGASNAFLSEFHLRGLLAGLAIHGVTCLLVGLLYGALLPIFPKYPIVTAGFITPLMMTGILHSAMGIISPILNQRIDWFWFVISQIAFGLVCGYVVNLHAKVRTPQFQALPLAVRAGLHGDVRAHRQDGAGESQDGDKTR
jgi:hypothetical protein